MSKIRTMREILSRAAVNDLKKRAVAAVCQIVSHQLAILKLWNDNNFHTQEELKTRWLAGWLVASEQASGHPWKKGNNVGWPI